jgi:uncharacterized protein (DUF1800 family)
MTNPIDIDAALALSRFGLGARKGSLADIGQNPRGALRDEVAARQVAMPTGPELKPTRELLVEVFEFQKERNKNRGQKKANADAVAPQAMPSQTMPAQANAMPPSTAMQAPMQPPNPAQRVFLAEVEARFNGTYREPAIGFGERLTMFWANHFAVAIAKGEELRMTAGAFEREAIRPHVFGRFEDMLLAVETHPAMLVFLDNQQSVGPDSRASNRGKRGLNENLAREIMELHTLGVDGGYTQRDVTSLARIITGWTVVRNQPNLGTPGTFAFNHLAHEPAAETLLGVNYPNEGFNQGVTALRDLARRPATAHHLAVKLARHFVADQPPQALVDAMAASYTQSRGDLSAVYTTMLGSEEAWNPELAKIRSPLEYVVALLRASGERPKPQMIVGALNALGQPIWNPSGPNGFSDTVDAWASSEGLGTRIEIASLIANAVKHQDDPARFAGDMLGALLTNDTRQAIARAESKPQAIALAFLSPEFQRR